MHRLIPVSVLVFSVAVLVSAQKPIVRTVFNLPKGYVVNNSSMTSWGGYMVYNAGQNTVTTYVKDPDADVYFDVRPSKEAKEFCTIDSGENWNTGARGVTVRVRRGLSCTFEDFVGDTVSIVAPIDNNLDCSWNGVECASISTEGSGNVTTRFYIPDGYVYQKSELYTSYSGRIGYDSSSVLITFVHGFDGNIYFDLRRSADSPAFCTIGSGEDMNSGKRVVNIIDRVGLACTLNTVGPHIRVSAPVSHSLDCKWDGAECVK